MNGARVSGHQPLFVTYPLLSSRRIFLRQGLLFACFEYHGTDYEADMCRMAADPETQRWWELMDPMQTRLEDAPDGEKWTPLQKVFQVDWPRAKKR